MDCLEKTTQDNPFFLCGKSHL